MSLCFRSSFFNFRFLLAVGSTWISRTLKSDSFAEIGPKGIKPFSFLRLGLKPFDFGTEVLNLCH